MRVAVASLLLACAPAEELAAQPDAGALADAPVACTACSTEYSGDPPRPGWVCVRDLAVELVHLDDRPAAGVTAMSCSRGLCMAADSDALGRVHVQPCSYVLEPTFRVVGFDRYVSFAMPLRNPTESFVFERVPITPLPAKGVPFAAVTSMNGVVLEAEHVEVDPFGAYADFRACPLERVPSGLDRGLGFARMYALGPQDTKLEPRAKLSLPNAERWPAGAEVEVWLHNADLPTGTPAKMGEWWRAARAVVEGDRIVTAPGEGIPLLTVIGVRRATSRPTR